MFVIYPGGIAAISRGLSEATPPVQSSTSFCIPAGCQRLNPIWNV